MSVLDVLAAGDDVYVFAAGDSRVDMQELVCIGANLDTERFKIPAEKWGDVRARLGGGVRVIDCRTTCPTCEYVDHSYDCPVLTGTAEASTE